MRPTEARWFARRLTDFEPSHLTPCLNLGSSTLEFRQTVKPHIQREFIEPLERHGVEFIHVDMRPGEGIDIAGDLFDPAVQDQIRSTRPRALVLTNVLEHVRDRHALAELCVSLVEPGSVIAVSVPASYPYHGDPLDTMYRPSPDELASLFAGCRVVQADVIEDGSYRSDLRASSSVVAGLARDLARAAFFFYRPKVSLFKLHRLAWLFRPYLIACVVLQKESASPLDVGSHDTSR
jgi:hypothetical protein